MKTFFTFLINKCQYKTSYLIFAAEIKINIKNTTAFFNAIQTSCIKNRCMMDVLKVILFCSWGSIMVGLVNSLRPFPNLPHLQNKILLLTLTS
jgi:hypothetical protein